MSTASLPDLIAAPADDLLVLTASLVAVPSVSRQEGELADHVERRLAERASRLALTRVGNTVIARTELGRERRIVLGGHLDTVPANGNEVPRLDGDVLHGLGSADMKGGLAVLLRLAEEISAGREPRFDCTLAFYEGEEIADEFNGLRHVFAERPELLAGDFAVLLEPTGDHIEAGCQGTLHLRAHFEGERAHSARQQCAPISGGLHAPWGTVEQAYANHILQIGDCLRYRGLGNGQALGRLTHAA